MRLNRLAAVLVLVLLGCSGNSDKDSAEPAREGAFDDMVGTLDRAEGAEQQIMDSADARRRALEEEER